jgi:hypothetical protein
MQKIKSFLSKWQWAFFFGVPAIFIILWMTCGEYVSGFFSGVFAVLGIGGFIAAFIYLFTKSGRGGE